MAQTTIKRLPDQTLSSIPEGLVSYDVYSSWLDVDRGHIGEWVNGRVVEFAPPDIRHQLITAWLATVLTIFARMKRLGMVLAAPIEVRGRAGSDARQPDVVFLAQEHLGRADGMRVIGAVDLAVEIVSRMTALAGIGATSSLSTRNGAFLSTG
jgi:Uma2 family endonuclease